MDAKEIIGLDVGQKHTGMARASTAAKLAQPLKSILTSNVADELHQLMRIHQVESIVIGLPRNLNGDDTEQTRWVRQWVAEIKKEITAKFYWQDEALTSTGQPDDHAIAAATILQDFLDSSNHRKAEA